MKKNLKNLWKKELNTIFLVFLALLWPLKEMTYLTGSFGEFRKNHIHAGIDISTHGRIGLPVYAGESGLLYRVKTQALGFGKAVYIRLNDGKFLVYAHMERFSPGIERIVKEAQQKEERYQIDLYLKEKIPINKGDLIGYSGDTGGVAPHLHIELRDSEERPINPLSSFDIKDTTPPIITSVAICDPLTTYCISKNIPATIRGKVGLAVSAYDPSHGNRLGIYQIDLIVDGKLFFSVKMDSFSYDDFNNNFIMCNKDLYKNNNKIYYHLFRAFGNKLPLYPLDSDGILDLSPGKHSITINVSDCAGNKSSLKFNVISTIPSPKPSPQGYPCQSMGRGEGWVMGPCKISIAKEDQYYPIKVEIETKPPPKKAGELIPMSNIYNIKPKEAVFKKAIISLAGDGHIYKYEDGKWKYMDKDTITDLGQFAVFKDITPPSIRIISTYPVFRARIEDNGSGLDYDKLSLYIDGKKVIAEYSANKKELFYTMPKGKHKITCIASDRVGNISKKEHLTK